MPAPRGNTNAAKAGTSRLHRVRGSEDDHAAWSLMTPVQRGDALNGYLRFMESDEYESHSFAEWLKNNLTADWE